MDLYSRGKKFIGCLIVILLAITAFQLDSGFSRLQVDKSGRYLIKAGGIPFFWLGDTAWKLFIRLNRQEADQYLNDRAQKRFTVIQAHLLGWKLDDTNAYDNLAFRDNDFNTPNEPYWKHCDYIIEKAEQLGLYMALIPAWASTYTEVKSIADGMTATELPLSKDSLKAYQYGFFIGKRYKARKNIIWVLGGDVWGRKDAIYDNLARGITDGAGDGNPDKVLISFHPQGGTFRPPATSTGEFYHQKKWLDFNMIQSGHNKDNKSYERISADYSIKPIKPTLDSEPCYEQHPVKHKFENGVFDSWDVRRRAYWSLFAGAFGFTYGGNGIWQMDKPGKILQTTHFNNYWYEALNYEGAKQMTFVRNLMESRPFVNPLRIPDQSVLKSLEGTVNDRIQCIRSTDHSYMMIYSTNGRSFKIDLSKMSGKYLNAWWYNPRDGKNYNQDNQQIDTPIKVVKYPLIKEFRPPGGPADKNDWVLVLDKVSGKFDEPGKVSEN